MTGQSPLTAKQQKFIQEYLADLNATQAAIRAGYSKKTAKQMGTENLAKPAIQEAIVSAQREHAQKLEITTETVLKGLHAEANEKGEGSSHSARVNAWTALGKHLGMFKDRFEHSGPNGSPIQLQELPDFKSMTNQQLNAYIAYQKAFQETNETGENDSANPGKGVEQSS